MGFIRPTSYTKPSTGGTFAAHVARRSGNPGVDYPCPAGTRVNALEAGTVVGIGKSLTVGWWVAIDYDNGWGSDFLHNREITVAKNARVVQGEQVAWSGATGTAAKGAHCHASLRDRHGSHLQNRGNVDLEKHLSTTGSSGGSATPISRKKASADDMSFRLLSRNGVWWGIVISERAIIEINSATDTKEYYSAYRIHGDGSAATPDLATNIDITEEDLRIEYVQVAKRRAQGGSVGGGGGPLSDADIAKIAKAVIAEQKLPGN